MMLAQAPASVLRITRQPALALGLLLALTAHASGKDLGKNQGMGPAQVSELARVEHKLEALAKNYAMLACSLDFEQIMTTLRQDCADAQKRSSRPPVSTSEGPPAAACSAKVTQQAVEQQEARLNVNFWHALQGMRHAVVPFKKGRLLTSDLRWLDLARDEQLRRILAVPLIDSTKLLLVTADSDGLPSSDQRLELVRSFLIQHVKLPHAERHIDQPLLLNVAGKIDKLRYSFDHPRPGEPKDLSLWVWIFRLDC